MIDLIFDLIGILFDLFGDILPVILAVLGYLLFGRAARRGNKKAEKWGKWIEEVTDFPILDDEEEAPAQAKRTNRPSTAPDLYDVDVYDDWREYELLEQREEVAQRREVETVKTAPVAAHAEEPSVPQSTYRPVHSTVAASTVQPRPHESAPVSHIPQQRVVAKQVEDTAAPFSPREALKWAIIFSPPRAKAPYRPPSRTNQFL